jgi:hypothetical protein
VDKKIGREDDVDGGDIDAAGATAAKKTQPKLARPAKSAWVGPAKSHAKPSPCRPPEG